MTDKQQSAFFLAIVFLFTTGIGLVIYRQYDQYYAQKAAADLEAAQTPSLAVEKLANPLASSTAKGEKIYKNSQYRFEINYPSNYWISTTTQSNVGPDLESVYSNIDFRSSIPGENPSNSLVINGLNALEYPVGGNEDGGIDYEVYFPNENIGLAFSTKKPGFTGKLQEFKNMLQTFKFVK